MPQLDPNNRTERAPFQIAQESHGETTAGTETHTATEAAGGHAEGEHRAGEVPNASLLFANSILIVLALVVFALAARRQYAKIPGRFQNFAEYVAESLNNFTVSIIGPGGERFTPLVGTVFLYILLMNLIGQIPGFHSPTANPSITFALGFVVFVYAQIQGILTNGPAKYVEHFTGDLPWQGIMIPIKIFLFFIELVSELIKPFTLAIRLFGNIFGEDVIVVVLAGLAGTLAGTAFGWIPLQFPLLLLGLLTSTVQALVFAILTCIYLSLMSHKAHGDEHGEDGSHDAGHAHA